MKTSRVDGVGRPKFDFITVADVRLLVACALADVLRIFAPEPPYEEETNADVIKLFIKILRGFQSPDMTPQHPSYK